VQQELIAEIQPTAIWPVVVTVDGNISKPDETDFIDRDGSYIILISDGDINSLKAEILGLILVRN
jgi:archaellum component FlaG (FlaF/FlaG flagellin family)